MVRGRRAFRSQVEQLLASLGSEVGSVATALADAGVRGVPCDGERCAVAVYLHAVVGADRRVQGIRIGTTWMEVRAGKASPPIRIRHSSVVAHFIRAFDEGVFPELAVSDPAGASGGSEA
jgi:hypothetical protein